MSSRRRLSLAASLLLVGALTVAFVGGSALLGAAQEEEVTVHIELFRFDPDRLGIATGTTVTWINDEMLDYPVLDGTHRVVADDGSFDSGPLQPGQRFSHRFLAPVTVPFVCSIHPLLMSGEITATGPVVEPEPTRREVVIVEPDGDPQSWGYQPDDITVQAGTTVVWRNNGAQTHTVTAEDGSFDSGDLAAGGTFEVTFDEPVTVRYVCTPHPWMSGLVRVGGSGGEPPPQPPSGGSGGSGTGSPVEQPGRVGNEPATFTVLAVEPRASDPLGWGFEPAALTIRAGDSVEWRNSGGAVHTVTAANGSFDSGDLAAGEAFSWTFAEPATVRYACTPHPWMEGTILIVPAQTRGELPVAPPPRGSTPPPPGSSPGQGASPGGSAPEVDADPAAAVRVPLAVGTGGLVLLLGMVLIASTLLERGRRRAVVGDDGTPVTETLEPVGVADGDATG